METTLFCPEAVIIGCSAGGMEPLRLILRGLPADFNAALIIISHSSPSQEFLLPEILAKDCQLPVQEATERNQVLTGQVYLAPPNYHLLIEQERVFSLSVDERVNYSRPAIDISFSSAAEVYRHHLIGIVLSGANFDGAQGLKQIQQQGGLTLVQNPETAFAKSMPQAALPYADQVLTPEQLMQTLIQRCQPHLPLCY